MVSSPGRSLAMTLGWLVSQLLALPVFRVVGSLNGYLLVFLVLGLVLNGTPRRFLDSVRAAVPAVGAFWFSFAVCCDGRRPHHSAGTRRGHHLRAHGEHLHHRELGEVSRRSSLCTPWFSVFSYRVRGL